MKKDSKKFYQQTAEQLENSLIEAEFYKHYNTKVIYCIFVLVFFSNVLINIDHGSLPGCSVEIKHDLGMNNF